MTDIEQLQALASAFATMQGSIDADQAAIDAAQANIDSARGTFATALDHFIRDNTSTEVPSEP